MEKALRSGADALILDLEDAVAPAAKAEARRRGGALPQCQQRRGSGCGSTRSTATRTTRISPRSFPATRTDRLAQGGRRGFGRRAGEAADRARQCHRADPRHRHRNPAAIFQLGTYGGAKRLAGLTWGAEDLPAAIGASTSREQDGRYTPPYELARSLCLFGAAAAGVAPIETVYPAFRDLDGLAAYAARARRDGFTGMMAIHPDQISAINAAFTPCAAEVAHARAVVAAFEAHPGAGALSLDGRMIDRPHLVQAQRILARLDCNILKMLITFLFSFLFTSSQIRRFIITKAYRNS